MFGASVGSQSNTKVEFFPDNTPNQIIVYIEYPEGTDIKKTNAITEKTLNNVSIRSSTKTPEYMHDPDSAHYN